MADIDIGDVVPIFINFRNRDGELADPSSVQLAITKPDATTTNPTPTNPSVGRYEYDLLVDMFGRYTWRWQSTGDPTAVEDGSFVVPNPAALVATPGDPAANGYLTVAEADIIAGQQGLGRDEIAWLSADDGDKQKALIRASSEIDTFVGTSGTRYAIDQPLLFPRLLDVDAVGDPYIIPNVRMATYHQAVYVLANAKLMDDAAARRARGLVSFSDDDASGTAAMRVDYGLIAPRAAAYVKALGSVGLATLRSVPIGSSYTRDVW